jgi:hypothetical protein
MRIDAAALLAVWDHEYTRECRLWAAVRRLEECCKMAEERSYQQNLGWREAPATERPRPGTVVQRSTPERANSGHASQNHHESVGHGQDRNPRLNRQGAETETHGQAPPYQPARPR